MPNVFNNPVAQTKYETLCVFESFTRNNQVHKIIQPSTTETLPKETNYVLKYAYGSSKPHAVTDTGL